VLESLREVYRYDAEAETQRLTPEARLRFHQEHSQLVMDALHAWFLAQFAEKWNPTRVWARPALIA